MHWFRKWHSQNTEGNFQFEVTYTPKVITSSSTVQVTSYTASDHKVVVPCTYSWRLLRNQVIKQLPQYRGSVCVCDSSYVGGTLQVIITSKDSEHSGTAILTCGTVCLDPLLRSAVSKALTKGSNCLQITLCTADETRPCFLTVEQNRITLLYQHMSFSYEYYIGEPVIKVEVQFSERHQEELGLFLKRLLSDGLDNSISSIRYSRVEDGGQKISYVFKNRYEREVFSMTVKAFITKRQIKNSIVLKKVENCNFAEEKQFDLAMEVGSLKQQIVSYQNRCEELQEKPQMQKYHDRSILTQRSITFKTQAKPLIQFEAKAEKLTKRMQALNGEIDHIKTTLNKNNSNEKKNLQEILDQMSMSMYGECKSKKAQQLQNQKEVMEKQLNFAKRRIAYLQNEKLTKSMVEQKKTPSIQQRLLTTAQMQFSRKVVPFQSPIRFLYGSDAHINQQLIQGPQVVQCKSVKSCNQPNNMTVCFQARQLQFKSPIANTNHNNFNYNPNNYTPVDNVKIQNRAHQQDNQAFRQNKELKLSLSNLMRQKEGLVNKVQQLHKTIENRNQQIKQLKHECVQKQKKMKQFEREKSMLKKNTDILNRSEIISSQMQSYHQQNNKVLIEQNELLSIQNEKLTKACERYMKDAKQAHKLRLQILSLKEQLRRTSLDLSKTIE